MRELYQKVYDAEHGQQNMHKLRDAVAQPIEPTGVSSGRYVNPTSYACTDEHNRTKSPNRNHEENV
eukprot:349790-Amphidinium_carterae.1